MLSAERRYDIVKLAGNAARERKRLYAKRKSSNLSAEQRGWLAGKHQARTGGKAGRSGAASFSGRSGGLAAKEQLRVMNAAADAKVPKKFRLRDDVRKFLRKKPVYRDRGIRTTRNAVLRSGRHAHAQWKVLNRMRKLGLL